MSAFICDDAQFEAVVNGWYHHCEHVRHSPDELRAIANELKRENIRSVNWRYNERNRITPCKFVATTRNIPCSHSIAQIIQWLNCIDYQSCERQDYEKSKAFTLIHKMLADLYYQIRDKNLFENLQWTLP